MSSIYIYGGSGHGSVVADIAIACGYEKVIHLDDGENDFLSFADIANDHKNIPLALGIGSNKIRKKLFEKVSAAGIEIVTLIHPSAVVSSSAVISKGTVIMPNVTVNAKTYLSEGVILNSGCVVEHDNYIGSFVHVSPNASLGGHTTVNEMTHIGIGASIIQCITIGKNCIIGAGSAVVSNIEDDTLAHGVPCKKIKDLSE